MSAPTFSETVNVSEMQKYRNLIPINHKLKMVNQSRVVLNHAENPMWPCPAKQFTDKRITCPQKNIRSEILKTSDEEINECCPLVTASAPSDDCSLPHGRLTGGAQPAVDKKPIPRYNPAGRRLRNEALSNDAKEAVRDAKNVMFNGRMIDGQVYLPVDINQAENNIRIRDRAQVVFHWKVLLEKNNREVTDEIEKIQRLIQQLMRCNRTVNLIINIDRDLQRVRGMRLPPDLIHDYLTDEIIKEETLCGEVINLNTRYIDEVKMQMKELKDSKQRLEHDWSDKKSAYDIDTACIDIKNSSTTIQWKPGCAHLPDGQSTPASHEYFVMESVIFIQAVLARSRILRENVKDMIQKSAKDLRGQANYMEMALIQKINETYQTCKNLERSLNKCLKSLADTENIFEKINGAVRKLDAPMKCAQTRLNMRLGRERVENCRDVPQFGLIDEVKSISEGVSVLMSQTKNAEQSIETLKESRQKIEKEITVKRKSLWVDNERCRLLRSFYPTDQALYGYQ